MLIVAIGVTAGTASQVSQKGGLVVLYIGKILYRYVLRTSTYDLRFNLMIIYMENTYVIYRTVFGHHSAAASGSLLSHNEGKPCRWARVMLIKNAIPRLQYKNTECQKTFLKCYITVLNQSLFISKNFCSPFYIQIPILILT